MMETEKPGREAIVTEGEKMAERIIKDIASGTMQQPDRAMVRGALDKADAPLTGRDRADGALGRISQRG